MLKEYKQVKDNVKYLLEDNADNRNSDKVLLIRYAEEFTDFSYKELLMLSAMLERMPNFESIRRSRQKIQQDNPHLRSDKQVERAKREEERLMTTELGSAFAGMTKAKDDMSDAIDNMKRSN